MTATDKRPLISESVAAIQNDIQYEGKNLTDTSYTWPLGSHVWQPSVKSLLSRIWAPAPRIKACPPAIVWPGRHLGLPNSPSNKPPQSREVWFDKVVTELLGLSGPINPTRGQNYAVLNRHRRGLPPWDIGIAMTLSSSFPFEWSTFP
jgi:hypothetical protein